MKTLKTVSVAVAALLAITAGCSGNKETKVDKAGNETASADIRGQWYIENIVFSDSDYVRPDEVAPSANQYMVFEDSTYFIMTNCNSIAGEYSLKGDSITLGDGAMTEMACDNMATEDALRRILPRISTIDIQSNSVIRLNGATAVECILLRKAKREIK